MKQNWEKGIGEFIRDVTKVGSIPKSEVRGRLSEIMREAKQEERERILKEIEEISLEFINVHSYRSRILEILNK